MHSTKSAIQGVILAILVVTDRVLCTDDGDLDPDIDTDSEDDEGDGEHERVDEKKTCRQSARTYVHTEGSSVCPPSVKMTAMTFDISFCCS